MTPEPVPQGRGSPVPEPVSAGSGPPLKLRQSGDSRSAAYEKIACVHRQIVEAKWRARTAGVPLQVSPNLTLHCEEAIAFLAEEMLKLGKLVESVEPKLTEALELLKLVESGPEIEA